MAIYISPVRTGVTSLVLNLGKGSEHVYWALVFFSFAGAPWKDHCEYNCSCLSALFLLTAVETFLWDFPAWRHAKMSVWEDLILATYIAFCMFKVFCKY